MSFYRSLQFFPYLKKKKKRIAGVIVQHISIVPWVTFSILHRVVTGKSQEPLDRGVIVSGGAEDCVQPNTYGSCWSRVQPAG